MSKIWLESLNDQYCRPETDLVLPEPDQHRKTESSFRFRFTGTGLSENQIPFRLDRISKFNQILAGFQNLARFLPDFKIQPDSYRNPKFCRKITGIYNFAGFLLKFYKVIHSNFVQFSLNTDIMSTKFGGLRGQIKVLTMLIT